ncbi:TolC family protein [Tamlana sp. 2_MG-2023]|uniref:TolC family protein n=1 Tax=unclassified Tamlana TaxID=2614803 RepID=UPI0026E32324|nr:MULTISPECIES: TolC family protein [unclassified Tamlana]MDO6761021.1 TolC family protein [Tamlana sp. 2_MG-2023]MDO6791646.1 TolC family protein [Tamlana sp. 1_MG-2023]
MKVLKNKIIVGFLLAASVSFAQQKIWTLQECVDYALENNITVKQGQNNLLQNEQDVIAAKGQFLPSVSGSMGHSTTFGSEEVFSGQFVNRTSNSTNVGIGLNQTIFNGFRLTNLYRQSKLSLESNQLELDRIKDDISLNVVNAYLNVLFNKERLEIAKAQQAFSTNQLIQVKDLVEAGVQPRANIYDAEATVSLDAQEVTLAENNYNLALLSLSQLLQVSYNGFEVAVMDVDLPSSTLLYNDVQPVLDYALENRNEIRVAEKNIEIAQLNSEISKSGYYPSVTGGYNFGSSAFFSNLTDDEPAFFDQLDSQKSNGFRVSVNIPIFSRFENKTNVAKSKIDEENSLLNLNQAKIDLESNIQRAFTDAQGAFKSYVASKKALEAQEIALENTKERFNAGIITSFDLEQSRVKYVNAQSSLINAKYDFVFKTKVLDFYMGKPITD